MNVLALATPITILLAAGILFCALVLLQFTVGLVRHAKGLARSVGRAHAAISDASSDLKQGLRDHSERIPRDTQP